MNKAADDKPLGYALRFHERALRDVEAAFVHFAETASVEIAVAWREGLAATVASLAESPRRFPLAPERFRREIRQVVYRRTGSEVAYRLLFAISGEASDAAESPTVTILHVRHGASRPLSRAETQTIEAQNSS